MNTCTRTYMHTHTCTHTYMHTHVHIHTHVHTRPRQGPLQHPQGLCAKHQPSQRGGGGRGLRRDQGAQPTLLFRSTQSNRGGKTHSAPQTSREPPRAGFSIGAEGEQEGEKEPHLGRQQSWLKERQDFPWGGGGWTGSDPEGTFSDARSRPVLEKR